MSQKKKKENAQAAIDLSLRLLKRCVILAEKSNDAEEVKNLSHAGWKMQVGIKDLIPMANDRGRPVVPVETEQPAKPKDDITDEGKVPDDALTLLAGGKDGS